MVKLYVKKINDGDIKIEDVPVTWRAKVQAALDEAAAE